MTGTPATGIQRERYRYGASFLDRTTGLRWEAHHPATRPDRWSAYLEGAIKEYETFGLSELVDRDELASADGISVFFVGVDAKDRVVAGVRCYGPLEDAEASQALSEMATSAEEPELREAVRAAIPHGVIELKGMWRAASQSHWAAVTLGRCAVHSLHWLGAEVALGATADRLAEPAAAIGWRMIGTESAPYPSEEYRTVLLAWDRARHGLKMQPDQERLVREESEQLRAGPPPGTDSGWRPLILDPRLRMNRQIVANLRADPRIDLIDAVSRQREELHKLLPAPDIDLIEEPECYVYYPWRKSLIRMVGPRAYPVIRLDRNRNRITHQEQEHLRTQRIGLVGLSSGHAIAATLALEGLCGELRLADMDEMELTNLNRIPASVLDVGLNKAVQSARRAAEIDPYLPIRIFPQGISPENVEEFVTGLDVVVEECDAIDIKVLLREVARRHRVPVVMETSDRGMLDVERFDQEPDRPIFHGLLPGVTADLMSSLPLDEKIPFVLEIVGTSQGSARGGASLLEIGRTLSTWPQLAGDVALGSASVAEAVRRLGLGEPLPSGRVRIDLGALVATLSTPPVPDPATWADPPPPVPVFSVTGDSMALVAHAASLAPSGGNSQPWRFAGGSEAFVIELDCRRTSTMDLQSRGSYVALGAALFNARVAAASIGKLGPVSLFPDWEHPEVIAKLTLTDGADPELADLYPAVLARHSNRRSGARKPLDLSLTGRLAHVVSAEGARLHLVTDQEQLAACADVLGESERIRFLTTTLHSEMIDELRWPGDDIRTGIDVRTLELGPLELAGLKVVCREDIVKLLGEWDAGEALGDNMRTAVRSSSALAVVTVPSPSPSDYVRGGAAVERFWVTAQSATLGVQAVSPVFLFAVQDRDYVTLGGQRRGEELHSLSGRFRHIVDLSPEDTIALVLRLSHVAPPTVGSLRLPLEEMFVRLDPAAFPPNAYRATI